jgi:hypothetical protein
MGLYFLKNKKYIFLIILLYFYLKIILFTFWDAKLLIKFLYSKFSNILFSIDKMANLFNLSCDIVILDRILSILVLKIFFSAEATLTGIVNKIQ